jgi:hypothetical protein
MLNTSWSTSQILAAAIVKVKTEEDSDELQVKGSQSVEQRPIRWHTLDELARDLTSFYNKHSKKISYLTIFE